MKANCLGILTQHGIAVMFTAASIGALIVLVRFRWLTEKQVVLIAGCTYTALLVILKVRARRQPGKWRMKP